VTCKPIWRKFLTKLPQIDQIRGSNVNINDPYRFIKREARKKTIGGLVGSIGTASEFAFSAIGDISRFLAKAAIRYPQLLEETKPFAGLRFDFRRLAEDDLVLPARTRTDGLRIMVDFVAERLKVPLTIIADIDSTIGRKAMAAHCGCYMIKAPHTISNETARGVFASSVLRSPFITRHVTVVAGRQRPLSWASREVASRLTATLERLMRR
jgi:hypothetical protein